MTAESLLLGVLVLLGTALLAFLHGIALSETDRTETTDGRATHANAEAELRRLCQDNEALRFSSLRFGELAERLSQRVRELQRLLNERDSVDAAHQRDGPNEDGCDPRPFHCEG